MKTRQEKTRQGKTRQDKTRQDKRSKTELYMARSPPSEKEPSSDSSLCSDNTELEGEGRWVCWGVKLHWVMASAKVKRVLRSESD